MYNYFSIILYYMRIQIRSDNLMQYLSFSKKVVIVVKFPYTKFNRTVTTSELY